MAATPHKRNVARFRVLLGNSKQGEDFKLSMKNELLADFAQQQIKTSRSEQMITSSLVVTPIHGKFIQNCLHMADQNSTYVLNDICISKRHLRIHCVVFEEEYTTGVAPLIYAQDLSSNGTSIKYANSVREVVSRARSMPAKDEQCAILLTHGDELHLTPDICLLFEQFVVSRTVRIDTVFDDVQRKEQDVHCLS
jgi:hypothetical protein